MDKDSPAVKAARKKAWQLGILISQQHMLWILEASGLFEPTTDTAP